jgi:hypothetical protein
MGFEAMGRPDRRDLVRTVGAVCSVAGRTLSGSMDSALAIPLPRE